ncbi:MAG TPA: hypothetical protein VM008_08550 [Phycisphaerae bacterium]|nr:hypothetical protein [Phycisphaerae bacterium]
MFDDFEYRELRIAPRLSSQQVQALADRAGASGISPQEYVEAMVEKLTLHMARDTRFPEKVILHEDVYVQAVLRPDSHHAACVAFAKEGGAQLLITPRIYGNVQDGLREAKVPKERADELIRVLNRDSELVGEPELSKDAEDEDSLYYVNLAISQEGGGGSQITLVTENPYSLRFMDLQTFDSDGFVFNHPTIRIVNAEAFMRERAAEDPAAKATAEAALPRETRVLPTPEKSDHKSQEYIRLERPCRTSDKVVFDGSVYRRALLVPYGPEAECLAHAQAGWCKLVVTRDLVSALLHELKEVDGVRHRTAELVRYLKKHAEWQREPRLPVGTDVEGFNLALANRKENITLVSSQSLGNASHLFKDYPGVHVVSAHEFLKERENVQPETPSRRESRSGASHVLDVAKRALEASRLNRITDRVKGLDRDIER